MDYAYLNELSPKAYDYVINEVINNNLAPGKYNIGEDIQVQVHCYNTKIRKECVWESHYKYIDIQIILEGQELMCVTPVSELEKDGEYISERDIVFYKPCISGIDHLVKAGEMIIFNPKDGHMPNICVNEISFVKKVVVKLPYKQDLF